MTPISAEEFEAMEKILASMLEGTTDQTVVLKLHVRLTEIYQSQSAIRSSAQRLATLRRKPASS